MDRPPAPPPHLGLSPKRRLAAALLAASLLGTLAMDEDAGAAPTLRHAPGRATPPAAAPVWSVDKAASRLSFRASLAGRPLDGVFKSWDAQIAFDPRNLKASRAVVTVETASVLTGMPAEDSMLPSPTWLWTRRFSKATLVTRSIAQIGPARYQAIADLRIRGVSRRIAAPFTFAVSDSTGELRSTVILDRTAFGVGPKRPTPGAFAPEVAVTVHLFAKRGR